MHELMHKLLRRRRRGGFTLIELLLVMVIIAILVAILVVAVNPKGRRVAATAKTIDSLDRALEAYRQKFGVYPPSKFPGGSYPNAGGINTGSQSLYYFLMGPAVNKVRKGWQVATASGGVTQEYVWEPAMDLSEEWIGGGEGGEAEFFLDGWPERDGAILYYRASLDRKITRYDAVYTMSDNNNYGSHEEFWTPTSTQWKEVVERKLPQTDGSWSSTSRPHRPESYLLTSPGIDRVFGVNEGKNDDVRNF